MDTILFSYTVDVILAVHYRTVSQLLVSKAHVGYNPVATG